MATIITENRVVMGQPVYRFEIETDEGKEYFDQGWKSAVKAEQLSRKGINFVAREWDKKSEGWFDATEETIFEGRSRLARSRNGKGEQVAKEYVPTLSDDQVVIIQNSSATLKMVAQYGKKGLPDEDTKQLVGMELMQVLSSIGYEINDIKNLVKQYANINRVNGKE